MLGKRHKQKILNHLFDEKKEIFKGNDVGEKILISYILKRS